MFHPLDHPLERGWVGRIEGDRVIQLAAQTLQSLFTGGGQAREHAEYLLDGVRLLPPVLHPPAVRVFEDQTTFAFANPAAIVGPGALVRTPHEESGLRLLARAAGVVGADGAIAGFTIVADWRESSRVPPKDRDFAIGLGPIVVTPDELELSRLEAIVRIDGGEHGRGALEDFEWTAARDLVAAGTRLYPGDLLVSPTLAAVDSVSAGSFVELEVPGIGMLEQVVSR
ncbi:MAG: fumarylacetoacetate hydrolase family protein [Gaiellaceae bacterium]